MSTSYKEITSLFEKFMHETLMKVSEGIIKNKTKDFNDPLRYEIDDDDDYDTQIQKMFNCVQRLAELESDDYIIVRKDGSKPSKEKIVKPKLVVSKSEGGSKKSPSTKKKTTEQYWYTIEEFISESQKCQFAKCAYSPTKGKNTNKFCGVTTNTRKKGDQIKDIDITARCAKCCGIKTTGKAEKLMNAYKAENDIEDSDISDSEDSEDEENEQNDGVEPNKQSDNITGNIEIHASDEVVDSDSDEENDLNYTDEELRDKKKSELQSICKLNSIAYSGLNKPDLILKIIEARPNN